MTVACEQASAAVAEVAAFDIVAFVEEARSHLPDLAVSQETDSVDLAFAVVGMGACAAAYAVAGRYLLAVQVLAGFHIQAWARWVRRSSAAAAASGAAGPLAARKEIVAVVDCIQPRDVWDGAVVVSLAAEGRH